jgi:hypothetical protein
MARKIKRRRLAVVKDLRTPKYKLRVVQDKKKKNKRVTSTTLKKEYYSGR